jgi:hypothetical protein
MWAGRASLRQGFGESPLHHDDTDNIYAVVKGSKRFLLFPPEHSAALYPIGHVVKVDLASGSLHYKPAQSGLQLRARHFSRLHLHKLADQGYRTRYPLATNALVVQVAELQTSMFCLYLCSQSLIQYLLVVFNRKFI